ncbi:MAG: type I-E CRISPR-associated protein Cas5/CasD [Thermoleophilia bacterium]
MSADSEVLALRLEGTLQAWGDSSRWSVRDTRPEPTKSAVIGIIAACFGWRLDAEGDRRVAELARSLRMGIRADREGIVLRDYHTVGGTRSGSETPWTGLLTAEGKVKRNPASPGLHTEVSERNYLSDGCYLVAVEGTAAIIEEIEHALVRPLWPPFLGRKSCVPTAPLYPARADVPSRLPGSALDVLRTYPWLGRLGDEHPATLRVVVDENKETSAGLHGLRHDLPESLARRLLGHRYVREFTVPLPSKE